MACYDIDSFWGSHTGMLAAALDTLEPGALVIEHGSGLYSSPLIARYDVHVLVVEELPGWLEWAGWLYGTAGRKMEHLDRAKRAIPHLATAGLVFIDGAARERGDLLKWALDAGSPSVIAHDTEEDSRKHYNWAPHLFAHKNYTAEHDGRVFPRTTMWKRNA